MFPPLPGAVPSLSNDEISRPVPTSFDMEFLWPAQAPARFLSCVLIPSLHRTYDSLMHETLGFRGNDEASCARQRRTTIRQQALPSILLGDSHARVQVQSKT